MKELVAFLLPPATALAGARINRLILGKPFDEKFGFGLRFGLGLGVGMLFFSQTLLLAALAGINLSVFFAWTILLWGAAEAVLLLPKLYVSLKHVSFQRAHLWLLALLPVLYLAWAIGPASVLEGTQEFDANAFWLLRARMLYFEHGREFLTLIRASNLASAHMDYPLLVPCLYTLSYGAVGGADEYVIKAWPFWMLAALCFAILSLGRVWRQPHPAPILLVVFLCFLPASMQFVLQEGATLPMVFGTSMAALLLVTGLALGDEMTVAAGVLALAVCATIKFEGIIYVGLWGAVLLFFCRRRGWWKSRVLWKAGIVAAAFQVPYFCYRLAKPVLHPASGWMHDGAAAPRAVLRRLPQTFFLNMGYRFFDLGFFSWKTPDNDHLQFAGHWQGLSGFASPELSVLPWILLLLVTLSFWKKPLYRLVLGAFMAVILGEFAMLALVITCLPIMQTNLSVVIEFACDIVGRYYYPFFAACFLGTMALWFLDGRNLPDSATLLQKPEAV